MRPDHQRMQARIRQALSDRFILAATRADFMRTFNNVCGSSDQAEEMTDTVLKQLQEDRPLTDIETSIYDFFRKTRLKTNASKTVLQAVEEGMSNRAQIIFEQIRPELTGITGKVLDFGMGDGEPAQKLKDALGLDVEGVDVRDYRLDHVDVPVLTFDGKRVPCEDGAYEALYISHVLHHDENPEGILKELTRVVRPGGKAVILETVPVGNTAEELSKDYDITYMTDYLHNRLFHDPSYDISVPGTFDTPEGWIKRTEAFGWRLKSEKDYGVEFLVNANNHHKLVFELER